MRRPLTLLEDRAAETTRCTYCPKLCRPACPVSTVTARETLTPWGKMRALDELRRGAYGHDDAASRVAASYGCTGCMGCREMCLLDNPVADTLRDGRAEGFAQGMSPPAAHRFAEGFAARSQRLAARAAALPDLDTLPPADGSVAFVPGCTAVATDPGSVAAATRVAHALVDGGCALVADVCCGAPLLDAGDRAGFVRQAHRFMERLGAASHVVLGDAGCAYALRVLYPQHGLHAPRWRRVEHITELAARTLDALPRRHDLGPVRVHDSCRLGRGLGVYDAPRAALKAITGADPAEMPASRERAVCSGGGGILPVTMPDVARDIAREAAHELDESARGMTVVTGCASSRARLREAGLQADDFVSFFARAARDPNR